MSLKYIGKDTSVILFPTTCISTISLNSLYPVDKIRVSISDQTLVNANVPGLLVWSDIVNNYIGTCATNYTGNNIYSQTLRVNNGIEYWFDTKMLLQGEYNVRLENFAGTAPTITANSLVIICVEYFIYN